MLMCSKSPLCLLKGVSKEKITTVNHKLTTAEFLPDVQKNFPLSLTQNLPKLRRKKERGEIGHPALPGICRNQGAPGKSA